MELGIRLPDYAKFVIECEPDRLHTQFLAPLERKIGDTFVMAEWKKLHKVTALGSRESGCRRYIIEMWGYAAARLENLPFQVWSPYLTRLDLRRTMYSSEGDFLERLAFTITHSPVKLNVESFDTQPRSKREGRDAGGFGFRVGSRKSDLCIVMYRRGKELPCVETRHIGAQLDRAIEHAQEVFDLNAPTLSGWRTLYDRLSLEGANRIKVILSRAGIDVPFDGMTAADIPIPTKLLELYQLQLAWPPLDQPEPKVDTERFDPGPGFSAV